MVRGLLWNKVEPCQEQAEGSGSCHQHPGETLKSKRKCPAAIDLLPQHRHEIRTRFGIRTSGPVTPEQLVQLAVIVGHSSSSS
jgi:hypothetical protein